MAAALRAAEGGYIFSKSSGVGGVFSKFIRPGGVYPPTPYSRPLLYSLFCQEISD